MSDAGVVSPPPDEKTSLLVGELVLAAASLGASLVGQQWAETIALDAIQNFGERILTVEEAAAKLLGAMGSTLTPDKLRAMLDAQAVAAANVVADAEEIKKFGRPL